MGLRRLWIVAHRGEVHPDQVALQESLFCRILILLRLVLSAFVPCVFSQGFLRLQYWVSALDKLLVSSSPFLRALPRVLPSRWAFLQQTLATDFPPQPPLFWLHDGDSEVFGHCASPCVAPGPDGTWRPPFAEPCRRCIVEALSST